MARNRIPDDRTWWSPWSIARVDLKRNIRSMLEENYDPRKHPVPSVKSAINLYKSCMNQPSREALGLGPMMSILNKIGGWPIVTRNWSPLGYNWESAYIYLRSRLGLNYIISMYVDIDSKDTSRRIIYVSFRFQTFTLFSIFCFFFLQVASFVSSSSTSSEAGLIKW